MRWALLLCSHCGGELHTDYSEAALVCLRCGAKERLPRLQKAREAADRANGLTTLTSAVPDSAVGLVEVALRSRRVIQEACATNGHHLVALNGLDGSPHLGQGAAIDLLIVEADRGGRAVRLAKDLRASFPAAPVAVILTHWCEAEAEAGQAAEFVLHAPLRLAEVSRVLQTIETHGGWLPAPLLASKYRTSLAG
jgi:hypothetical protein